MYRVIYKCPDCGGRPKTLWSSTFVHWQIWCHSTIVNNVNKRVAMAQWNEMAAAKFARRAVSPKG